MDGAIILIVNGFQKSDNSDYGSKVHYVSVKIPYDEVFAPYKNIVLTAMYSN